MTIEELKKRWREILAKVEDEVSPAEQVNLPDEDDDDEYMNQVMASDSGE